VFDPAAQPEGTNAAFHIKAYDMAGNLASDGAWNLVIDKTAPNTQMEPLDAIQGSNAFLLKWTATDNLSGIDYLEVQEKINAGGWNTQPPLLMPIGCMESIFLVTLSLTRRVKKLVRWYLAKTCYARTGIAMILWAVMITPLNMPA
jgi:hypothetical protein